MSADYTLDVRTCYSIKYRLRVIHVLLVVHDVKFDTWGLMRLWTHDIYTT